MTFPNEKAEIRAHEIEKTKAEIQVLTKKLSFLEDMQKHQKSPAEEAYKRWWGEYPGTETWTIYDETRWVGFQKGYNTAYEEKDKPSMTNCVLTGNPPDGYVTWNEWYGEMGSKGILHNLEISSKGILHTLEISSKEYQPTPLEKLQESNWYVDPKTLLKSNWEPKTQTPEETEKSLKDAMKTAKSEGVFDEPETLTLKQLLKKWEIDFSAKWEYPRNKTSKVYEEEVERFIQMFTEWMPDAIGDVQDDWDDGYNSYRNAVMEKLK
jgi:hypothetical protein